ncbi:hypothetical protein CBL_05757 [Carabus blaptoides fortunei]
MSQPHADSRTVARTPRPPHCSIPLVRALWVAYSTSLYLVLAIRSPLSTALRHPIAVNLLTTMPVPRSPGRTATCCASLSVCLVPPRNHSPVSSRVSRDSPPHSYTRAPCTRTHAARTRTVGHTSPTSQGYEAGAPAHTLYFLLPTTAFKRKPRVLVSQLATPFFDRSHLDMVKLSTRDWNLSRPRCDADWQIFYSLIVKLNL